MDELTKEEQAREWLYTVIHEAGHSVAAEALSPQSFEKIVMNDSSDAHMRHLPDEDKFVHAVVSVAGSVAIREYARYVQEHNSAARWHGKNPLPALPRGAYLDPVRGKDRRDLDEYLNSLWSQGWQRKRDTERVMRSAMRVVYQNRNQIINVATALSRKLSHQGGHGPVTMSRQEFLAAMRGEMEPDQKTTALNQKNRELAMLTVRQGNDQPYHARQQIGELRGLLAKQPPEEIRQVLENALQRNQLVLGGAK